MATVLESDLQDVVDLGKKQLVDFNTPKTQVALFDWSNSASTIDVKIHGLALEKSSFKMLGLSFSCKLDRGSYIISIAKTASKKTRALIHSMKFLLLKLLSVSINLFMYGLPWNTVVMSGLVFLAATWKC